MIQTVNTNFYHADGDLCLKLSQRGHVCIESPDSYIEHYSHVNEKVRMSNSEKQRKDWKAYENQWSRIYSKPDKDWIEKEFEDPTKTASKFKKRWFKL